MEEIFKFLFFTTTIAIAVVVYTCVIVKPGEILSMPWYWAVKYLPVWLHKPLISCEKCVGGQAGLIVFPFFFFWEFTPQCIILHILFSLNVIFLTQIVKKWLHVEPPTVFRKSNYKPPELNGN